MAPRNIRLVRSRGLYVADPYGLSPEKGCAAARCHGVAEREIGRRDIAEIIGKTFRFVRHLIRAPFDDDSVQSLKIELSSALPTNVQVVD
jgi:hypothetical protein